MPAEKKWMQDCAICLKLVERLASPPQRVLELQEVEEARVHLVNAHLAALPGYVDDCANCQEWKALAAHPDGFASAVVLALVREDLMHRADHLLFPAAGVA